MRRTARASSFSAALELVREGTLELGRNAIRAALLRASRPTERAEACPRRRQSRAGWLSSRGFLKPRSRFLPEDVRIAEALVFATAEPSRNRAGRAAAPRLRHRRRRRIATPYAGRGVNLVRVGGRWMFRTAPDLAWLLARERWRKGSYRAPRSRRWRSWPITSR